MKAITSRLEWIAIYIRGSKPDPEALSPADDMVRKIAFSCMDELFAISEALSGIEMKINDKFPDRVAEHRPIERIIDLE